MVEHRTLRKGESLLQQCDRSREIVAVGERTSHHDPPFGDQFRARRRRPQFLPQFRNLRPLTQCSIAVSQYRMLVGGITQEAEGLEFASGLLPLLLAIESESIQLMHSGNRGRLIDKLFENPRGITESLGLEVFGCLGQSPFDAFGPGGTYRPTELLTYLSGEIDRNGISSTRSAARNRNGGLIADLDDERRIFRHAGVIRGAALGVGRLIGNGTGGSASR